MTSPYVSDTSLSVSVSYNLANYRTQVARRPLESEHGDPITLLNAFEEWVEVGTWSKDSPLENLSHIVTHALILAIHEFTCLSGQLLCLRCLLSQSTHVYT